MGAVGDGGMRASIITGTVAPLAGPLPAVVWQYAINHVLVKTARAIILYIKSRASR